MGTYLAAKLARCPDVELSLLVRPSQLATLRNDGLTLHDGGQAWLSRPRRVVDNPDALPWQDIVFVTLKAHAHSQILPTVAKILKPQGVAVFVANGLPWWYVKKHARSDQSGINDALLSPQQTVACVAYSTNALIRPGVVAHSGNNLWLLGAASGGESERLSACIDVLRCCELDVRCSTDIDRDIWIKLLRNASLGPIAALCQLTHDEIGARSYLLDVVDSLVDELASVAQAVGVNLGGEVAAAKQVARRAAERSRTDSSHRHSLATRPSILDDALCGKPMEVDALLGGVQLIASAKGVACPTIAIMLALLRGLDASPLRTLSRDSER